MRTNVATLDRGIRWIAGWLIVAFALAYHSDLYIAGLVLAATGIIGYCPLYSVFNAINRSLHHTATPHRSVRA